MKHATTRMLFAYWDGLRGERAAPERGEIEPGEIRHVLADTFILDLEPGTAAFRLAGTRLCALFGRELRGTSFESLWGARAGEAQRYLEMVTDETAGLIAGLAAETTDGERLGLELILLPLRHRGRTHARVLGALSAHVLPEWLGQRPLTRLGAVSMRVIWPSGRSPHSGFAVDGRPVEGRRAFVVHQGGRP